MRKRYAFRVSGGRLATAAGRVVRTDALGLALGEALRGGARAVVELRWNGTVWYAEREIALPRGGKEAVR